MFQGMMRPIDTQPCRPVWWPGSFDPPVRTDLDSFEGGGYFLKQVKVLWTSWRGTGVKGGGEENTSAGVGLLALAPCILTSPRCVPTHPPSESPTEAQQVTSTWPSLDCVATA